MNSAIAIANHFIQTAMNQGLADKDFPAAKVHGLVYLAHGWLLGSAGAAIINSEVMAHADGVFIPQLKDAGCWGTKNVTELVAVLEMDKTRGVMVEQTPKLDPKNPIAPALDWVWKTYGTLSSFQIVQHIREPAGPWDRVWNERDNNEPQPVPNDVIRHWYRKLSSRREQQGQEGELSQTQRREREGSEYTQRLLKDSRRLRSS